MQPTMQKKRKMRELALQALFAWDAHGEADRGMADVIVAEGSDDSDVRRGALEMAGGAWEARAVADPWVERIAPQWPPRRQPGVDRNLLRLAVWELTHADTPPKVVIDEAIELAKEFSTEQSAAFVNGVLDAVLREHRQLIAGTVPAAAPATELTMPDVDTPAVPQAPSLHPGVVSPPSADDEPPTPDL